MTLKITWQVFPPSSWQTPVGFAAKDTDAGTVATAGLSDVRFTVMPLGAGVAITSDTSLLPPGAMFMTLGTNTRLERTWTVVLTLVYWAEVAVIVAAPKSTPKTLVDMNGAV